MKRSEFFKEVGRRTGLSEKTVKKVFEECENMIMEIFATNDYLYTEFGKIEGEIVPPIKVQGFYSVLDKVVERRGWSCAKSGKPKITFNKKAKLSYCVAPEDFFNSPEERLTTLAREYRKDVGLPEIPEYEGLSESKIRELCKKVDKEKGRLLSRREQRERDLRAIALQRQNLSKYKLASEIDLQRQRDNGVPEDQLQIKDGREVYKELRMEWAKRSHARDAIIRQEKEKARIRKEIEEQKKELDEEDEKYFFLL